MRKNRSRIILVQKFSKPTSRNCPEFGNLNFPFSIRVYGIVNNLYVPGVAKFRMNRERV